MGEKSYTDKRTKFRIGTILCGEIWFSTVLHFHRGRGGDRVYHVVSLTYQSDETWPPPKRRALSLTIPFIGVTIAW